ncbi:MAG: FYDLN acid domain-containing protein [Kiloniellaceae bacterium]
MLKAERGIKHSCTECGCKYYDLKKKVAACPKCGAKASLETPLKSVRYPSRRR